ncbi:MAG: hypothetical protein K2X82_07905 [Gemmataceae bacterium]|nr:hypothetical protein [Gemmataceae bacterium]
MPPSDGSDLRRSAYLLLTAAAVAVAAAKVVGAEGVLEPSRYTAPTPDGYSAVPPDPPRYWPKERPEPTPAHSSNDKSRWATVRALVEDGTYAIGTRSYPDGGNPKRYRDEGIRAEPGYASTDVVLRPLDEVDKGKAVTKEFYSSKPPLFSTLLAGEYWVLNKALGWNLDRDRWLVIPTILLTVNVLPFAVYLVLLGRLLDATGKGDFGRLLAFTAACFGTFLTTFAGTLNNHLPAAFCVLFASYPLLRAMAEGTDMTPRGYLCCGFFAGFAATFDHPAAAFLAAVGLPLLIARPRPALLFFVPAALIPVLALVACNVIALGTVEPVYDKFDTPWYKYDGSHWSKLGTPQGKGLDFNDEPTTTYAFHLLLGHHGWFSLTPVFVLGLAGLVGLGIRSAPDVRKLRTAKGTGWTPALWAAMTLVVSAVVFGFYLTKTKSYNYGGFTSGPRWLFWLIPLWLLAVPPAADRLARSAAGRLVCAVLLGLSVLSAFYPSWNPWRHPWLHQLLEYTGVLRY